MSDKTMKPDGWEETVDPASFWIRSQGEMFTIPIVDGMVFIDGYTYVPADEFRAALARRLGPGTKVLLPGDPGFELAAPRNHSQEPP